MPTARSKKDANSDGRHSGCAGTVDAIKKAGAPANFCCCRKPVTRATAMVDKNNLQIADRIIGWVGESTATR